MKAKTPSASSAVCKAIGALKARFPEYAKAPGRARRHNKLPAFIDAEGIYQPHRLAGLAVLFQLLEDLRRAIDAEKNAKRRTHLQGIVAELSSARTHDDVERLVFGCLGLWEWQRVPEPAGTITARELRKAAKSAIKVGSLPAAAWRVVFPVIPDFKREPFRSLGKLAMATGPEGAQFGRYVVAGAREEGVSEDEVRETWSYGVAASNFLKGDNSQDARLTQLCKETASDTYIRFFTWGALGMRLEVDCGGVQPQT